MAESLANNGLYLHVPYCKALCHYCDFAKTANFKQEHGRRYLELLASHLDAWVETLKSGGMLRPFESVFFGGGTPSLFADDYAPLLARIRPLLAPGAEVSLEANPDDITRDRLNLWRDLGVNRLSLGVQTFQPAGLAYLKRVHDAGAARTAADLAQQAFDRVSLDLIYGWGSQSVDDWRADLDAALATGVTHLSLYTLTYEGRTPLGRAANRGLVKPQDDDTVADMFDAARSVLGDAGFIHEEVSNWAKPGSACRHNWGYWQDQPYLGIGAGAHGYLRGPTGVGRRYAYPRDDRAFLRRGTPAALPDLNDDAALAGAFGIEVEAGRTTANWVSDYVGAALRTKRGIDLNLVRERTGADLSPTPTLAEAIERGLLRITTNERLLLDPSEWFRETAWGVEVLLSLESAE